jgi:hypothetical protein
MSKFEKGIWVGFIVTFILCTITHVKIIKDFKREAKCRGFANHHPLTGEWRWNASRQGYYNHCTQKYSE